MSTLLTDYALFSKMILEEKAYLDPDLSFEDICNIIGAEPGRLDMLLVEELGMSGEEILSHCRNIGN